LSRGGDCGRVEQSIASISSVTVTRLPHSGLP
jgi:hypothetical protein